MLIKAIRGVLGSSAMLPLCVAADLLGGLVAPAAVAAPVAPAAPAASDDRQQLLEQVQAQAQMVTQAQEQRDAGRRIEALALVDEVLARSPEHPQAAPLQVHLLAEMGAPQQALVLSRKLAKPLPEPEQAKLEADLGAHQTRWARGQSADPRRPYVEADRAVQTLDHAVARQGGAAKAPGNTEVDRLIALDQAGRTREAVVGYDALLHRGGKLPPYAEAAMADALLGQRRPQQSISLYEDSIRRFPPPYEGDETDPRLGLMYAYLEAGRNRDAMAVIDRASAAEPAWLKRSGKAQPVRNPHKAETDLNAALVREYLGLFEDASQRLAGLLAEGPANAVLWREWGNLQRARGLPRAAEDAAVTSAGLDANDLSVRLGLIDDWRQLDDFTRVESTLVEAEQVALRDGRVQQARREWDRQRGWQFDLEHDRGKGGSPNYGDYDHETQATLMSPLLADHWRVYGITRLASAALPEGSGQRDRLGAGVRSYWRGLEVYAQVLPAIGSDTRRTALEAGLRWFPSDHWTYSLDWSNTGDIDVPLRANYYGITAHSINAAVEWRANESTSVKLGANRDEFSDSNRRTGWQGALTQRLYTAPNLSFDGGVQLGQSFNSKTDGPYYSPSRASWGMLTGRFENPLGQRYELAWRQRVDIGFGTFNERYYGSGWAASLRYGQTIQPRAGMSYGWGLTWSSQPYDGKRDSRVSLDLTMHWGE